MKKIIPALALLSIAAASVFGQSPSSVRRTVDYTIRDSVDNYGNLYIRCHSFLPSVLTFVNIDGSITVCSSDVNTNTTHIYEYDTNLQKQKTLSFQNELGSLGAFTKDNDGNYYFFYGSRAANKNAENMAIVKYNTIRVHAFNFPGGKGANPTYAEMGDLAKTTTGYIFAGDPTEYLSTFALVINENGEAVSDVRELTGIRLNINDTLRYNRHNKKVYWVINDSETSMTVYALDIGGL